MMTPDPAANPYDGSAAQIVPQNVEKIPLYHWRPGARLLMVGSRDGPRFDGDIDQAEANTFRRPLRETEIAEALGKMSLDGCCAAWSAALRYPLGIDMLLRCSSTVVIATPPIGDDALAESLLPRVSAWLQPERWHGWS